MENKQTAVEWLYQHLFPKQLDGFSNEEWNKIDMAFEKAKEMEKEQMMDIDYKLSVIEDYAKGEAGDEITKLRSELKEYYGK